MRIEQALPPARLRVGVLKVLYRLTTSLDEKLELSDEEQRQGQITQSIAIYVLTHWLKALMELEERAPHKR